MINPKNLVFLPWFAAWSGAKDGDSKQQEMKKKKKNRFRVRWEFVTCAMLGVRKWIFISDISSQSWNLIMLFVVENLTGFPQEWLRPFEVERWYDSMMDWNVCWHSRDERNVYFGFYISLSRNPTWFRKGKGHHYFINITVFDWNWSMANSSKLYHGNSLPFDNITILNLP